MKKISYQYCMKANYGTEEYPEYVDIFLDKTLNCHTDEELEKGLLIAKQEAYNEEYTIEEVEDEVAEPTPQEDTDAMLIDHEYRLTLLELGLTEY